MPKSKKHYNPSQRTETEDLQVQEALNEASANQMAGFVDALLLMSDQDPKEDSSSS